MVFSEKKHFSDPPTFNTLCGDLVFCLTKKAGSTSLGQFFVNNLEPADEMAWMSPFVDQVEQAKYVESRSSLHSMMMMD